jgi:hypothetical protein
MFQGAKRGAETLWGNCLRPMVFLWDSLDKTQKEVCWAELCEKPGEKEDWVVWEKAPSTWEEEQEEGWVREIGECIFK